MRPLRQCFNQTRHIGKTALDKNKAPGKFFLHGAAALDRVWVTVDGHNAAISLFKKRAAVAAITKGGVQIIMTISWPKRTYHLL